MNVMTKVLLVVGLLAASVLPAIAAADEYTLTVHIGAVRGDRGQVHVELYNSPETFRKIAKALRVLQVPAQKDGVSVKFEGIVPGRYAILAFHDEDENGEMNKRFGMIPTEGYALSNDPQVFGPPAFKDSAFEVQSDLELNIPMHY